MGREAWGRRCGASNDLGYAYPRGRARRVGCGGLQLVGAARGLSVVGRSSAYSADPLGPDASAAECQRDRPQPAAMLLSCGATMRSFPAHLRHETNRSRYCADGEECSQACDARRASACVALALTVAVTCTCAVDRQLWQGRGLSGFSRAADLACGSSWGSAWGEG